MSIASKFHLRDTIESLRTKHICKLMQKYLGDVGTIDQLLMSNDANKHCPGDSVSIIAKVPSSFGTRKSNILHH